MRPLLGYLLAASRASADDVAVEVNLDAEGLIVIGAALAYEDILHRLLGVALDYLLQGGLIVGDRRLLLVRLVYKAEHEFLRRLYAAVEIYGCKHRLECIGEYGRAILAAGEHLALAEEQKLADTESARKFAQRLLADEISASFGQLALGQVLKVMEEMLGRDKAEHRVAQKFKALVAARAVLPLVGV